VANEESPATPNGDGAERHLWIVFTNSEPGRDDEFNAWYDEHHVKEIVAVPGFVWGQRLALHPDQRPGQAPPPWRYAVLYESVGDLPGIHRDLKDASPGFVKSGALSPDSVAWVFSYRGERTERPSGDVLRAAGAEG
jgi:hypothetical protein